MLTLATISTLPQSAYAYQEEKAWRYAERYGMTAEKFKAQHSKPTHLDQIIINANIHWRRIKLGELFASWGTPDELFAGISLISSTLQEPQSPSILSKLFPSPPTVENQSF